jgi:hypothetical protein
MIRLLRVVPKNGEDVSAWAKVIRSENDWPSGS